MAVAPALVGMVDVESTISEPLPMRKRPLVAAPILMPVPSVPERSSVLLTVRVLPETTDNPVTVPALPVILVWSPVLVPVTDAVPATVRLPLMVIVRSASFVTRFNVRGDVSVSLGRMVSDVALAPFTVKPVWFRFTDVMSVLAPAAALVFICVCMADVTPSKN